MFLRKLLLLVFVQVPLLMGNKQERRINAATKIADDVFNTYKIMFDECLSTSMSNHKFVIDNLHSYINAFSKTTVGYAPVFTGNRKFFANMINTGYFKNMLSRDVATLQNNFINKMKFCDEAVMDEHTLRQFYDREVDQTKL